MRFLFLFLCLKLLTSCIPILDNRTVISFDSTPPAIQDIFSESATSIRIESLDADIASISLLNMEPELLVHEIILDNGHARIDTEMQEAGKLYFLELAVYDAAKNMNKVVWPLYGFNDRIPHVLINELIVKGSATNPDIVELRVMSEGNMAGVTIFNGIDVNYTSHYTFPAMEVKQDDFILVHFRPQGISEEINETEDKTLSGGLNASDLAYDHWLTGATGLSASNGVISLFSSPRGDLIDGVLYSNRTQFSDERYRGFGLRDTQIRAERLFALGGWLSDGDNIVPEDGINPDPSTATRSINRSSTSVDTDTKYDWHIVPTRGSTLGYLNNDDVY